MKLITPFHVVVYLLLLAGACLTGQILAEKRYLVRVLCPDPLPAPQAVLDASSLATTNRFPGADAVIVDREVYAGIKANGDAIVVLGEYFKVLTVKGCREKSSWTFPLFTTHDRVIMTEVEIIKPDGRVIVIARGGVNSESNSCVTVEDVPMPHGSSAGTGRLFRLNVPGLEVDDLVHFTACIDVRADPYDPAALYARIPGHEDCPIRRFICKVSIPADKLIREASLGLSTTNAIKHTMVLANDGFMDHVWEMSGVL